MHMNRCTIILYLHLKKTYLCGPWWRLPCSSALKQSKLHVIVIYMVFFEYLIDPCHSIYAVIEDRWDTAAEFTTSHGVLVVGSSMRLLKAEPQPCTDVMMLCFPWSSSSSIAKYVSLQYCLVKSSVSRFMTYLFFYY